MKKITKEKVWIDDNGNKCYSREETLVSDDEYYTRKYYNAMPHENMDKIFEAYRDYIDSMDWG